MIPGHQKIKIIREKNEEQKKINKEKIIIMTLFVIIIINQNKIFSCYIYHNNQVSIQYARTIERSLQKFSTEIF